MRLVALLAQLPELTQIAVPNIEISHVTCDSRDVVPGTLFVAIRGSQEDGTWYVPEAVKSGAVAVVAERPLDPITDGAPVYVVQSARKAFAKLSAAINGSPSRNLKVIGVTGTNGKTTATFITRHLLESAGLKCGVIGTLGAFVGGERITTAETTPDAGRVQKLLRRMVEKNCEAAAIEVSSHALDQDRVASTHFSVGVFTNLSGEHLDYHGNVDTYFAAKAKLFRNLIMGTTAVLNVDDPCMNRLQLATRAHVVTYGLEGEADYSAEIISARIDGTTLKVSDMEGKFEITVPLLGHYNISNFLAAFAAVRALGVGREPALSRIAGFPGIPGRLERVDMGQPFSVFVDYAHTDDALEKVLGALRPVTMGQLIVVFGCGGDRDRLKRPRMGRVAGRGADSVVVTSDNPRSEDPMKIIREVIVEMPPSAKVKCIPDRGDAIRFAIASARPGDVVLIAGKGHETYQVFSDQTIPFDDREVVRERLRASA
ncbi:MAG: UDP-N-acetylmuramoyl-L-alanyl-D-glutamate--2,6-diaminopimelate ligase [Planctomycetota bacterium]|nr:MAG: UDP-N-acetylmuramoyl-L-alanyl-D-glutamate--2,6-diaminopimelate ligase [Planctomycetota bacterium]